VWWRPFGKRWSGIGNQEKEKRSEGREDILQKKKEGLPEVKGEF